MADCGCHPLSYSSCHCNGNRVGAGASMVGSGNLAAVVSRDSAALMFGLLQGTGCCEALSGSDLLYVLPSDDADNGTPGLHSVSNGAARGAAAWEQRTAGPYILYVSIFYGAAVPGQFSSGGSIQQCLFHKPGRGLCFDSDLQPLSGREAKTAHVGDEMEGSSLFTSAGGRRDILLYFHKLY